MNLRERIKQILGHPNTLTFSGVGRADDCALMMCPTALPVCWRPDLQRRRHYRLFRRLPGTRKRTGVQPRQSDGSGGRQTAGLLALIMLAALGWVPAWIVCIIIGRELAVTGLRNIIAQNEMDVSASMAGQVQNRVSDRRHHPLLFHYSWLGIDFHAIGMFFSGGRFGLPLWS
jgi:hypothetical protein